MSSPGGFFIARKQTEIMTKQGQGEVHVFFIVNQLYTWSQNFITRELTELNKLGLKMTIGARSIAERDDLTPEQAALRQHYFEIPDNPFKPAALLRHLRLALSRPGKYLKAWGTLFSMKHKPGKFPRGIVCLFRAAAIAEVVEKRGVTLIHAHFFTAPAETALYLSVLTGIPYGGTAYAMDLYVDDSGLETKLHHARYINGTTKYNEAFIRSRLKADKDKALTLYYGIPTSEKLPEPIPHDKFTFVAVGRLVEKKGFKYLLEACAILKQKGYDFRCRIIGSGPLEEEFRNRIRELGLEEVVEMPGFVAPNEMEKEYRAGDVLAAPCVVAANGDVDGLPNVCLEAMHCGLPVISTTISGIPEGVEEGVNGWLIPPNDTAALAEAMEKALNEKNLAQMRVASHRMVREKFDVQKNALPIRDLLLKVGAGS
ncbi:MAG: hypothetical protein Kow0027_25120 [Saprospiraceae bacterium]